jgi:FkbM family methyltransferase
MILKFIKVIYNFYYNSFGLKTKLAIFFGILKCEFYIFFKKRNNISFLIGGYKLYFPNPKVLRLLIKEILINEDYYIELENNKPLILDCGSNLGMSILYFKLKYPESKIIGIEADPSIFCFLKNNVKEMTNVEVLNKFISIEENKRYKFYSGGPGDLRGSFDENRGGENEIEINSVSISRLFKGLTIDLIKMDIEGAEGLIFNPLNDLSFLKRCSNLIIEYHHNLNITNTSFSNFLHCFEKFSFWYQVQCSVFNKYQNKKRIYQDILLTFKKI